jgi:DNA-binding MurR/RpiR family transcriptional regulator
MNRPLQTPASHPPDTVDAFHDRLARLSGHLPRRLQQCADHLAAHADRIALSTVAQIATAAGVPPSAVMRFCQVLGFSGFAEMQRLFRSSLATGLPDYATRLANLKSGPSGAPAALVAEFIDAGRLSLEALAQSLNESQLDKAVSCLARAGTIHLAGLRRSYPVVAYLAYVFDKLGIPALLHDATGGLAHRAALRPGDVLLVVSFAPYSAETLALAEAAKGAGLSVVALSDRQESPLARLADTTLTVTEVDFGAFRSLSATIALALSLAVAVAARRGT